MSGVERLGVTGDDIEKLRARKRREKLGRIILVGLAPIAGLTAGYIIGTAGQPEAAELTYPLAISAVYATGYTRSRPTLAAAVILGILAFAFATVLTSGAIAPDRPALMYSVYSADE